MKKALLTSVLFFVLIGIGFSQWEKIELPDEQLYVYDFFEYKGKLYLRESSQYFVSDEDSIHWQPLDSDRFGSTIIRDTVFGFVSGDNGKTDIISSTDMINWTVESSILLTHNPVYPYAIAVDYDNLIYYNSRTANKLFPEYALFQRDTIVDYFNSQTTVSFYQGRLSLNHYGKKEQGDIQNEITRYHSTGDRLEYVDYLTEIGIVKTPDNKKYVIERGGDLKEKIRHDQYRYVIQDSNLLAKAFIRTGTESVLEGFDTISQNYFIATYSDDSQWEIVFESPEEYPFSKIKDEYLFGKDSFNCYVLNLETGEFNSYAYAKYPGPGFLVERGDKYFYTISRNGVWQLNDNGVWMPKNEGLISRYNGEELFMDGETVFTYSVPNERMHVSDDRGATWREYTIPPELMDTPRLNNMAKGIFRKGNKLVLVLREDIFLCDDNLTNCELKVDALYSVEKAFRHGDKIIAYRGFGWFYRSEDFGATWEKIETEKLFTPTLIQKNDTLSFVDYNGEFFYSFDFGKTWEHEPTNLENRYFVGFENGNNLFAITKKRRKVKGIGPSYAWVYYSKKLGETTWQEEQVIPVGGEYLRNFYRDGSFWYFFDSKYGLLRKSDGSYLPRNFRRKGLSTDNYSSKVLEILGNKIYAHGSKIGLLEFELKR